MIIEINGVNYFLNGLMSADGGNGYKPLIEALIDRCTDEQISSITNIGKNNKKTIVAKDLFDCFVYTGPYASFYEGGANNCICGVNIEKNFVIVNCDTKFQYIVGSKCIENWSRGDLKIIRQIKKDQINDDNATLCQFCNKNTTKKKCNNCKEKRKTKENLKSVFDAWRKVAKDKFDFPKYIHLNYSYYRFMNEDIKNKMNYLNFILRSEYVTQEKKNKIMYYLNENEAVTTPIIKKCMVIL